MKSQELFESKLEEVSKKHGFKNAMKVRQSVVDVVKTLTSLGDDQLFKDALEIVNELTKTLDSE